MKLIPLHGLGNNLTMKVSDHQYDLFMRYRWRVYRCKRGGNGGSLYAHAHVSVDGKSRNLKAGRLALGLDFGDPREADHINGDSLDNQVENLRVATRKQQAANKACNGNSRTGYKGVRPCKCASGKVAYLAFLPNGSVHVGGRYDSPEAAAFAYDAAVVRVHGGFARLNFPAMPAAAGRSVAALLARRTDLRLHGA